MFYLQKHAKDEVDEVKLNYVNLWRIHIEEKFFIIQLRANTNRFFDYQKKCFTKDFHRTKVSILSYFQFYCYFSFISNPATYVYIIRMTSFHNLLCLNRLRVKNKNNNPFTLSPPVRRTLVTQMKEKPKHFLNFLLRMLCVTPVYYYYFKGVVLLCVVSYYILLLKYFLGRMEQSLICKNMQNVSHK